MTRNALGSGPGRVTAAEIVAILVSQTGLDADAADGQAHVPLVDLGMDSLAVLELQAEVLRRYGVEVPESALEMSVTALVAHINDSIEVAGLAGLAEERA
jgi:acyl carrier protein